VKQCSVYKHLLKVTWQNFTNNIGLIHHVIMLYSNANFSWFYSTTFNWHRSKFQMFKHRSTGVNTTKLNTKDDITVDMLLYACANRPRHYSAHAPFGRHTHTHSLPIGSTTSCCLFCPVASVQFVPCCVKRCLTVIISCSVLELYKGVYYTAEAVACA
jgi:hypothetical protein